MFECQSFNTENRFEKGFPSLKGPWVLPKRVLCLVSHLRVLCDNYLFLVKIYVEIFFRKESLIIVLITTVIESLIRER